MEYYKQLQQRKYYLIKKYEKLLCIDPINLAAYRIQNFMKKKLLFEPFNNYELNEIPIIYRFRFIGISNVMAPILYSDFEKRLNKNQQYSIIWEDENDISSSSDTQIFLEYLRKTCDDQLIKSTDTIFIPFVIDIRKFNPISCYDILYISTEYMDIYMMQHDIKRLINAIKIIGNENVFNGMLEWSKELASEYKSSL